MNQPEHLAHYASVSDETCVDTGATDPAYPEIYPRLKGFKLGSTNAWTAGNRSTITAECVRSLP